MIVTYNWLKQYMDLSDVSPEYLAEKITDGGHEVESWHYQATGSNLVIGKVLTCVEHPDSDHLHICTVDTGDDVRQIVCGAPNVAAGQKVIVALPGCRLPEGEIKSGKVRGQQSDGMICALFELGVDKHFLTDEQLAGIEVLPEDAEVGNKEVLKYLGLDDVIYDVSLTPNRADCYSMWAFAKDVGAILGKKVTLPDYRYRADVKKADLTVRSETEKCPYFYGKVINHVEIKPSPLWMQQALHAAGVKAINNVVDISNYVMLETGQPLHFYNLAKIPAREITVKTGLNEMYTALDGVQYHVTEDDIMITTQGKAIGYAGIMGGDDSKIDDETTGIIIEAALFNMVSIRNTSRRLDLFTEAATRFAKGIDPLAAEKAVERSTQLLIELANASGIEETVICGSPDYQPRTIETTAQQINTLLGTEFTPSQIYGVFESLDFQPRSAGKKITVTVPSYRSSDVKCWQDLSEEVIRILGYDNIESTLPKMPTTQGALAKDGAEKRTIRAMLNGYGLDEVMTYSLVSQAKIDEGVLSIGEPVRVANALSEDRRYFRTSLLPSLMEVVSYNQARSQDEYGLFEIADVYSDDGKQASHLSAALSSKTTSSKWQKAAEENDFYTLKGIVLSLLEKLGYETVRISFRVPEKENEVLHPNKSAEILLDRNVIGIMGVSHPLYDKKYDVDSCNLLELDLSAVLDRKKGKIRFTPINRYPAISYDLALVVREEVSGADIVNTVKKAAGSLLKNVEIFDVYRGSNIDEGCKSVAVNVVYQSAEKTLKESDVADIHAEVLKQLAGKLGARLRD
ncbi:MAG: phenylalanine--tRNA ligase subunit beta [Erysipelotrichaceae bacterium]|nr:phenylalanine--tRNA ligase subunit beta [Erysipelotrichaceae bacterium]